MKINNLFNTVFFTFLVLCFTSCKEDSYESIPLIFTGSVQDITSSGAVFNGKVTGVSKQDFIEYGFVWSLNSNPTLKESEYYNCSEYPGDNAFSVFIKSGLISSKTYNARAYCKTIKGIFYGQCVNFASIGSEGPVINQILPYKGAPNDTIKIIGENFSNLKSIVKVVIKDHLSSLKVVATVIKSSFDTIFFVVPQIEANIGDIIVTIGEESDMAESSFTILHRWLRMPDYKNYSSYSTAITDGSRIFTGLIRGSSFYRYTTPNSYLALNSFPGEARDFGQGFIIGNYLYYGIGYNPYTGTYLSDFWKYNISDDTWTRLNDFPGPPRQNGRSFSVNSYGYVTAGVAYVSGMLTYFEDMWKYNPLNDSWSQINGFSGLCSNSGDYMNKPAAAIDDNGMVYLCGEELFLFNPISNEWSHISSFPVTLSSVTFYGFWHKGKVYVGTSSRLLYSYDIKSGKWKNEGTNLPYEYNYYHTEAIVANGEIIIGFGRQPSIWKYDPDI